ncbi:MAG: FMN-binding negative transcriptional regulator [Robiginitalea sp.]|nr:FMN-binding negative transcriptional regulator [Robiginitalea sp.]
MYIPPHYRNENMEEVREFLRQHAFGILVSSGPEVPMATHLPLELEEEGGKSFLRGHFAKANPQWKQLSDGAEVLCIFNGPHAYVSASWYREEEVPTWNYIAVHIRGRYRTQSREELWKSLRHLVEKYEADSQDPVSLDSMSPGTLRQVVGIVGFEIEITGLEAAYKLSQGRQEDHPRITEELLERGGNAAAIARAMRRQNQP